MADLAVNGRKNILEKMFKFLIKIGINELKITKNFVYFEYFGKKCLNF